MLKEAPSAPYSALDLCPPSQEYTAPLRVVMPTLRITSIN